MISHHFIQKAKANENWKWSFATGENAQVVCMTISTKTNPKNEIGKETHSFDQVILVIEGSGIAELNGKTSSVDTGDMIFIPQGTVHNVVNSEEKALKIISFYSSNDMPSNTMYKTKKDEVAS